MNTCIVKLQCRAHIRHTLRVDQAQTTQPQHSRSKPVSHTHEPQQRIKRVTKDFDITPLLKDGAADAATTAGHDPWSPKVPAVRINPFAAPQIGRTDSSTDADTDTDAGINLFGPAAATVPEPLHTERMEVLGNDLESIIPSDQLAASTECSTDSTVVVTADDGAMPTDPSNQVAAADKPLKNSSRKKKPHGKKKASLLKSTDDAGEDWIFGLGMCLSSVVPAALVELTSLRDVVRCVYAHSACSSTPGCSSWMIYVRECRSQAGCHGAEYQC